MWVQLVWAVIISVFSYVLTPKPKIQNAAAGSLDIPTVARGDDAPVYFGTVWEKNPKVVYYGNPTTKPITTKGGKK